MKEIRQLHKETRWKVQANDAMAYLPVKDCQMLLQEFEAVSNLCTPMVKTIIRLCK